MSDFHIWTSGGWIMAAGQIVRTDPDRRGQDALDAAVVRLNSDVVNDHLNAHALAADDLDLQAV